MPATLARIVESSLYARDLEAERDFYRDVLGLEVWGYEADRHVFFRVGDGVLLIFNPATTITGDHLPAHGATGAGHVAFGVAREELDAWRNHLIVRGVAIASETNWPHGGRSIYFYDPAGNVLEIVTPGVWGLPSGW